MRLLQSLGTLELNPIDLVYVVLSYKVIVARRLAILTRRRPRALTQLCCSEILGLNLFEFDLLLGQDIAACLIARERHSHTGVVLGRAHCREMLGIAWRHGVAPY